MPVRTFSGLAVPQPRDSEPWQDTKPSTGLAIIQSWFPEQETPLESPTLETMTSCEQLDRKLGSERLRVKS